LIDIQKYTPYYDYNPFNMEDLEDVKNFLEYSKNLILHNKPLADSLETVMSMSLSSDYISSRLETNELSESERNVIISTYKEYNPYYENLYTNEGIDYLVSRTASDFQIIKVGKNILSAEEEAIFNQAFKETLDYFLNVTYTNAFSNQDFERQFFQEYLIFSTFLNYNNKKMELYFDIDHYNKYDLKNAFISNGVDYFDDFPINYQRRILKKLNDLTINKGSDDAFYDILNLFSFESVQLNRYILSKSSDGTKLLFHKVPLGESLNLDSNPVIDFNAVIDQDPYWRVEESDILNKKFNSLTTKYLSIDTKIDILKDTCNLSFFMSMLNDLENYNFDLSKIEYEKADNMNSDFNSIKNSMKLNSSFSFYNSNISTNPIRIYDAIIALIYIAFKNNYIDDRLNSEYNINNILGVRNIFGKLDEKSIKDDQLLDELYNYLYFNKGKIIDSEWKDKISFLNRFNFYTFTYTNSTDFESILNEIKNNIVIKNQILMVIERVEETYKDTRLRKFYETEDYYQFFLLLISSYSNGFYSFNKTIQSYENYSYYELKILLKKFVEYQIECGKFSEEEISLNYPPKVSVELENYVTAIYELTSRNDLLVLYNTYIDNKSIDILKNLITICKTESNALLYNEYYIKQLHDINYYPELSNFLDIFFDMSKYKANDIIDIYNLITIYKQNMSLKTELIERMKSTKIQKEYEIFQSIYNNNFVTDYDLNILTDPDTGLKYNSYLDYLFDANLDLYNYVQPTEEEKTDYLINPEKYENFYKMKIFELTESVDSSINGLNTEFFINNNFIGMINFIKDYVYILVTIFKSFTTQLIETTSILLFNDSGFDTFKLLDDINFKTQTMILTDGITMTDVYTSHIKFVIEDLNLMENIENLSGFREEQEFIEWVENFDIIDGGSPSSNRLREFDGGTPSTYLPQILIDGNEPDRTGGLYYNTEE